MIINGPWSWANYEQAGINFGVAPLPSIDGQPSKPFIGVGALRHQCRLAQQGPRQGAHRELPPHR